MTAGRACDFSDCLPSGTRVPEANRSIDWDSKHTRTIGEKRQIFETIPTSSFASGGVIQRQEF
jgi:hypothetical protein